MTLQIECATESASRATFTVAGVLDEDGARELQEQVEAQLARGRSEFLLDLRPLADCKILGRQGLRELQERFRRARVRTAYVAKTPRIRGMTLIVINGANDAGANTFVDAAAAAEWLASDVDRKALNVARTEKNQ